MQRSVQEQCLPVRSRRCSCRHHPSLCSSTHRRGYSDRSLTKKRHSPAAATSVTSLERTKPKRDETRSTFSPNARCYLVLPTLAVFHLSVLSKRRAFISTTDLVHQTDLLLSFASFLFILLLFAPLSLFFFLLLLSQPLFLLLLLAKLPTPASFGVLFSCCRGSERVVVLLRRLAAVFRFRSMLRRWHLLIILVLPRRNECNHARVSSAKRNLAAVLAFATITTLQAQNNRRCRSLDVSRRPTFLLVILRKNSWQSRRATIASAHFPLVPIAFLCHSIHRPSA